MKILLNPKGILVILASLTVLGAGIAYAVNQISRDLPGSFAVGAVQTLRTQ